MSARATTARPANKAVPTTGRVSHRLIDVVAVVVLLAVSMVPLWAIYEHPAVLWLGGVSLAVGTCVAMVGARWPGYAVVGLTVIAYAAIGVPLAIPSAAYATVLPTALGLRELATGTVFAWREMVTVQIPFGAYESLLVPALVVVLFASVAGVSMALRARRPGWAVLAPAAVLTFGILFGSAATLWPAATGVCLVLLALAWATLRADPIRTPTGFAGKRPRLSLSTVRRYLTSLVLVVSCGAGAVALGTAWQAPDRDVLRDHVTPPFDVRDLLSPLVGFRNDMLDPGSEELLFTAQGIPDDVRVRLATLDTYNGMVFAVGTDASSGTFERVPYRVEHPGGGTSAHVTVTIDSLDGQWLPTVGNLTSISFDTDPEIGDRFYYNTVGSDAALLGELQPTTYTVDARVEPLPPLTSLSDARPGPVDQRVVDEVPQEIVDAAHSHGTGETPGEQLVALVTWLQTGYVSHSGPDEPLSRPGHSAERLRLLLTQKPMLGDAEQYATTMALLAREVGFPSRVVVGYAPDPGQTEFHGADTTAWVEVQLADGSWVGIDPNPEPREVPAEDDLVPDYRSQPESVLPPPPPVDDDPVTTQNDDSDRPEDPEKDGGWTAVVFAVLRGAGLGIGTLALLTLPIWAVALLAAVRRSGRRRRDRRAGVVTGAWNEIRDAMIDRGYEIHPAATRQEVAAASGSPAIMALAEAADRGVFSPEGFTPSDVGGYWSKVRAAGRSLDAGSTRRERLRHLVTLKSARSLRRSWDSWWRNR